MTFTITSGVFIDHIIGEHGGSLPGGFVIAAVESLQLFIGNPAVCKKRSDFIFIQDKRLRFLLMLLDHLIQLLVNVFDHFQFTGFYQGILDQSLEGLFLTAGG